LRRIPGAIAVLRRAQENPGKYPWLTQLLARRPFKVVAVALANKMARTAAGPVTGEATAAQLSPEPAGEPTRVEAMRAKIKVGGHASPYRLRKQLPEPVFGQIKQARGFRFLRCTAGRSKGSSVSSVMAAVAQG
jgi:hypothetical protein